MTLQILSTFFHEGLSKSMLRCREEIKVMNKKGSMKLIHVGDIVKEVFEITGFTDILTIE